MQTNWESVSLKTLNLAKSKGYHNPPNFTLDRLMIISELFELMQADRKDKRAERSVFDMKLDKYKGQNPAPWFEEHIKDTLEYELADCFLRIAGFTALYGLDIVGINKWLKPLKKDAFIGLMELSHLPSKPDIPHLISDTLIRVEKYRSRQDGGILEILFSLSIIVTGFEIDLEYFVNIKSQYNEQRKFKWST